MAKRWAAAAIVIGAVLACLPLGALGQSPGPTVSPFPSQSPPIALPAIALPLEGTPWRLRSYIEDDGQRQAPPEVAAWMSLRAGGLVGHTGCAPLRGRYGTMGEVIRFELVDAPAEAADCGARAARLDKATREGLRRAAAFELVPPDGPFTDSLVFRDGSGAETLRFDVDDIGGLETEEWQLVSYTVDGQTEAAAASLPAVLAFRSDGGSGSQRSSAGNVTGSSGCNGILGTYTRAGDVLSFAALELTEAACPADLLAQEAAILGVLQAPSVTLGLSPDRLTLTDTVAGDALDLVTATPFEGSTWLLGSIPGKPRPKTPVTLRLDGGVVSGEGPCGAYTGTYRTDGLFVSIRELRATAEADCPRRERQRELFSALERATLLERDRPVLGMLDAKGQVVVRFKRPGAP
jgi:heat shock protein HslJ